MSKLDVIKNLLTHVRNLIELINDEEQKSMAELSALNGKVEIALLICGDDFTINKTTFRDMFSNFPIKERHNRLITLLTAKALWLESILENYKYTISIQ